MPDHPHRWTASPRPSRRMLAVTVLCALVAASSLFGPGAQAAYPGANGRLYFSTGRPRPLDIWRWDPASGIAAMTAPGVNSSADDWAHYWSPDGNKMVFQSNRDGDVEIFVWDIPAGTTTQLTHNTVEDSYANWSPVMDDGRLRIVFQRRTKGAAQDLWVMNEDGSGQKLLFATKKDERHSAWSPLGNKIAFVSDMDRDEDIYLLNVALVNGSVSAVGSPTNLTNQNRGADYSPDWSPDGTQLVFARETSSRQRTATGENSHIWKMNADGTAQTLVIAHQFSDAQPDWSPDGTTIAFVGGADFTDAKWDMWTMDVNGGNVTRLTGPDPYGDFQPEWRNAPTA